jgi:SAM-dependent methyltransferase
MKQLLKKYLGRITENIAFKINQKISENITLADNIAYRVVLETALNDKSGKSPDEIFYGMTEACWFWFNTEGIRKNSTLAALLPGMPDEYTQEMYTGAKGDATLAEAFFYYKIVKEQYQKYNGDISHVRNMLDFGCGWGRTIRFFLKDVISSKIFGCDPVPEMIKLCKDYNKWCNFESINITPPSLFQDSNFDLIYSYSVLTHVSEESHLMIIDEIFRLLRPGGIYITTTRSRKFIEYCPKIKERSDFDTMNPGPKSSAFAFPDTQQSLFIFDEGSFCHHSFNDKNWPHWGESAIPKKYVREKWKQFKFLDYLEIEMQNIIIVQKPA